MTTINPFTQSLNDFFTSTGAASDTASLQKYWTNYGGGQGTYTGAADQQEQLRQGVLDRYYRGINGTGHAAGTLALESELAPATVASPGNGSAPAASSSGGAETIASVAAKNAAQNAAGGPTGPAAPKVNADGSIGGPAPKTGSVAAVNGQPAPDIAPGGTIPTPAAPVAAAPGAAPKVDANGNPIAPATPSAPAAVPGAPAGPGGVQSSYTGASIVDYLNSVGQASDFASRAKMAASLGISGYTGSAAQNTQMLNTLRSRAGGTNSSTTTAGAAAGATGASGTGTTNSNLSPDSKTVIDQATAIAKSFGWTAPDPSSSPLNIATNLFNQGIQSFGLNDLKTHINSLITQQNDLSNKQADEVSTVNSNPWLTDGERINRIAKIGDKYSSKLDALIHEQTLFETDYKTGLDQVQWQVGQSMTAYNNAQTNNEKIFSDALTLAEKQVDAKNALALKNAELASKTTVLSAGSSLVDANEKIVATAPAKATSSGSGTTGTGGSISITGDNGISKNIPNSVAPYYNVSSSGIGYVDASTLQGTAAQKTKIINDAQAAGLKIITNKNTAADLVNIKDANAKLDTVSTIMAGIGQPNWVARALGGLFGTKVAMIAESDPQKAASGALESIGLDILKAISGVQGFRGNQTAIQQVTTHLPTITDTVDTINKKVEYIKALISDREDAAVGKASVKDTGTDQVVNGITYSKAADGLYYPKK